MISDSIQVTCADVCRRSPLLTVSTLLAATATRYAPLAGLPLVGASALLIGLDSGVDSATSNLALVSTLLATWLSLGLWACAWRTRRSTRRCVRRHVGFRSQSGSWAAVLTTPERSLCQLGIKKMHRHPLPLQTTRSWRSIGPVQFPTG